MYKLLERTEAYQDAWREGLEAGTPAVFRLSKAATLRAKEGCLSVSLSDIAAESILKNLRNTGEV